MDTSPKSEARQYLQYLLDHHLKIQFYSETKNGVLLSASLGFIFYTTNTINELSNVTDILSLLSLVFYTLSLAVCFISFTPVFQPKPEPKVSEKELCEANLLYFGDASNQSSSDIAISVSNNFGSTEFDQIELNLANQIRTIAAISKRKFESFGLSISFFSFGFIFLSAAKLVDIIS